MPAILFICAANLCRSVIAGALLRRRVSGMPAAASWRIESAGLWAPAGEPAPAAVQDVLREWGLDLGDHRSRCVDPAGLGAFDLILTMEQGQKEALRAACPEVAARVHTLGEMAGSGRSVPDPITGSRADLEDVVRQIERLVEEGLAEIVRRAGYDPAAPEGYAPRPPR